ncbi:hypothetical protein LEP1GSC034_1756 [Leptospira interrogans str. 2003000735]|uniref:Uncharacterized protein n=4 Tax=Leptospira interrogans TaxID=173 RepID=M3HD60_LEPIR|nr:hypothetical protein LEP1GSC027_2983 [Leptospira interrogans str. 2002000624]EKO24655.1 hypothetical protein LEP1GSC104_3990 [Leptospira interrogans str. UI 12621]EKQ39753.1 hypothetical protein LEP1GSC025_0932 [Leptospira interrogans str. 2002000621]EKQ47777.1 hypothetical protein LEP1GSC026_4373 [Leptospira interrogans str. 2002000623]EKR47056.1 hypothetical protein LEP1GSC097_4620 [Leptospira interrogans serovar Grippotyphosa str. UI 08368]EMG10615.1 hypothetical protein LEP1GSC151_4894 
MNMNIFPGKIKYGCLWGMLIPFFRIRRRYGSAFKGRLW